MLTINMQKDNIVFKDITKENLQPVLDLFNQNENNIYATGIDRKLSIVDLNEKYLEVLVNSHEFFVGIFINKYEDMHEAEWELAGIIKGRIDYENSEEAWISSLLIDGRHQHQGIGKRAADAFVQFLNKSYDVKRVFIGILDGNEIGKNFWKAMGFCYIRTIEQYMKINNHVEDFLIMRKEITKK